MLVLYADQFGTEVSQALGHAHEVSGIEITDYQSAVQALQTANGSNVIFAMGRPRPRLLNDLDEVLIDLGIRWTAAILRERFLLCGPLHKPGMGACWKCFRRRWLSLSLPPRSPESESALEQFYDETPDRVFDDFLPPLVGLASAVVAQQLVEHQAHPPGALTVFDTLECGMARSRVVPLHGCRCRGAMPTHREGERFVDNLAAALRHGAKP